MKESLKEKIAEPEKEHDLGLSDYFHPWEKLMPEYLVDNRAEGLYKETNLRYKEV